MRESQIESAVCRWAKDQGVANHKMSGPNDRGVPDRLFRRKGRVFFCEFKAPGKTPTALQLKRMADLSDDGFAVGWCDGVESGKKLLKEAFGL